MSLNALCGLDHSLPPTALLDINNYDSTSAAVQTFMEKVVEECSSDTDYVWIHDYHLLVLPSLLRKRFNKIR